MNLRSILVAATMLAGSISAIGCAPSAVSEAVDEVAKAEQAEDASDAASYWGRGSYSRRSWGRSNSRVAYRSYWGSRVGTRYYPHSYWGRSAPPRARYEYIGRAPSSRHYWVNGYHGWNGRSYAWNGGRWDVRRSGRTWVQPNYNYTNGRYVFVNGYWM